jgi:hypothetical protein
MEDFMLMNHPSGNDLQNLRQVVQPQLAAMPTAQLRHVVDSTFGPGTAEGIDEDLEGIFGDIGKALSSAARDVGRFATKAAPAVASIGGGVLKGAAAGSALGLPGIIGGAITGGAGAGMSTLGSGAVRKFGQTLSGVTQLAGGLTPMGQLGGTLGSAVGSLGAPRRSGSRAQGTGALGQIAGLLTSPQGASALGGLFGGSSAPGQLAAAIRNPDVQRALAALRLRQLGRPTIPVGAAGQAVPTAAFAQLLGHLSNRVAAEAESAEEAEALGFMTDAEGGFIGDPASETERTARLWDMMNEAMAERVVEAIEAANLADEDAEAQVDGEDWSDQDTEDWDAEVEWAEFLDEVEMADLAEMDYAAELDPMEARHAW